MMGYGKSLSKAKNTPAIHRCYTLAIHFELSKNKVALLSQKKSYTPPLKMGVKIDQVYSKFFGSTQRRYTLVLYTP